MKQITGKRLLSSVIVAAFMTGMFLFAADRSTEDKLNLDLDIKEQAFEVCEKKECAKISQAFYGTWEIIERENIAPKGGYIEPDIWEGDRISFTGDGDIRYQVQYKSEDDACVLAVYFSYTDVRKQSENEFSYFYMVSEDEMILWNTHGYLKCRAKRISEKESWTADEEITLEELLRYDLQRRGWNESYLQQVLWGEWRKSDGPEGGGNSLRFNLDGRRFAECNNFYDFIDIESELRSFEELKCHNILWGISYLPENEKWAELRNYPEIKNQPVMYGMDCNNEAGNVFILLDENHILLVKENDFYLMVSDEEKVVTLDNFGEWLHSWQFTWGINQTLPKLELEFVKENVPAYYGSWEITEVLDRGKIPVEGAKEENPEARIGLEFDLTETDNALTCTIVPKENEMVFFLNEGEDEKLGLNLLSYYPYLRLDVSMDNGIYGFAMKNRNELVVLANDGYLYLAKRLGDAPAWNPGAENRTVEEFLKECIMEYGNTKFHFQMMMEGRWGINECIYAVPGSEDICNREYTTLLVDKPKGETWGYWGILPVDDRTILKTGTPTLRSMGVKDEFVYCFWGNSLSESGVFLVVDDQNMLYVEGDRIYRVYRYAYGHSKEYLRDEYAV
ncbi:MAG: hypothetical protein HDQ96_14465 [Lachnospiraceae bacterium]|nr:hypothetical protein [Lachnospiraceae bacterium]